MSDESLFNISIKQLQYMTQMSLVQGVLGRRDR